MCLYNLRPSLIQANLRVVSKSLAASELRSENNHILAKIFLKHLSTHKVLRSSAKEEEEEYKEQEKRREEKPDQRREFNRSIDLKG